MERKRGSNLGSGLTLIIIGALFLVFQLVPGLDQLIGWPLIVIGVGALLLVIGVLTGASGMAVPGCIVGGIGGLLYWQNATGNWESWSYAWALIPGFVGVGIIVSGLIGGDARKALGEGGRLVIISLVLFAIFGSAFGALGALGQYWPVLIILLGVGSIVQVLLRSPKE